MEETMISPYTVDEIKTELDYETFTFRCDNNWYAIMSTPKLMTVYRVGPENQPDVTFGYQRNLYDVGTFDGVATKAKGRANRTV